LQIDSVWLGQTVQCPECRRHFTATLPPDDSTKPGPPPAAPPPRERLDDDNDYDVCREHRPRLDDDDDDDDWCHPRSRPLAPHRANMVLTFGILSCFVVPIVMGSIAWFMGRADLRAMDEGRMDPSGRSMTQTGSILGIVMAVFHLLSMIGIVALLYWMGEFH